MKDGYAARAGEVRAVNEALEGNFATADECARAVLAVAYHALLERDLWIVVQQEQDGRTGLTWGPFFTYMSAVKALEENRLGLYGKAGVFQIHSATKQIEKVRLSEQGVVPW